jgi:hypothetical protein
MFGLRLGLGPGFLISALQKNRVKLETEMKEWECGVWTNKRGQHVLGKGGT